MLGNSIWFISIVLAIIGLLDSLYLTWVKVNHQYALCGPLGDCESVNTSQYSEIGGIPIALFGVGAYLLIVLILMLEKQGGVWKEYGPYSILGISLVGTLYSIYLTYLEIAIIHAICPYCVISAIAITILFILSILRLLQDESENHEDLLLEENRR
jgi:uncharacterized membrane protein